jgi:hypothetical protein
MLRTWSGMPCRLRQVLLQVQPQVLGHLIALLTPPLSAVVVVRAPGFMRCLLGMARQTVNYSIRRVTLSPGHRQCWSLQALPLKSRNRNLGLQHRIPSLSLHRLMRVLLRFTATAPERLGWAPSLFLRSKLPNL